MRIAAIGLFMLALLLAACSSDAGLLPPATVPAQPPSRINITRKDYEAALAKWQSQGIEEYEITMGGSSMDFNDDDPWVGRVSDQSIEVLRKPFSDSPSPTPYVVPYAYFTVATLFENVDHALAAVERGGDYFAVYGGEETGEHNDIITYNVTFDDALGYPQEYAEGCVPSVLATPWACPNDILVTERVNELTVLKRKQP